MTAPAENPENTGQNNQSEFEKIIEILLTKTPQEVADEFSEAKKDVDKIEKELKDPVNKDGIFLNGFPKRIKDNNSQELKKISEVVKEMAVAITFPEKSKLNISGVPQVIKEIANELVGRKGIKNITENNAFFIYKIIEKGLAGELNSFEGLKVASESIRSLSSGDEEYLYIRITGIFMSSAMRGDLAEGKITDPKELAQLRINKSGSKAEESRIANEIRLKSLILEQKKLSDMIDNKIDNIHLDLSGQSFQDLADKEAEMTTGEKNGDVFEETKAKYIKDNIDLKKTDLKQQIRMIYSPRRDPVISKEKMSASETRDMIWKETMESPVITIEEVMQRYDNFTKNLNGLMASGVISEAEMISLQSLATMSFKNAESLLNVQGNIGNSGLFEQATSYIKGWNSETHIPILKAMSDYKSFKEFIMGKYNRFDDPEKDWKMFEDDMRSLFDQIFSAANANPKDFWERSFNELTEGVFYKNLLMELRSIGLQLGRDPEMMAKNVMIRDSMFEPEEDSLPGAVGIGGQSLARDKLMSRNLSDAISTSLISQMIEHKETTETLHNYAVISDLGYGFKQMAEYSGRVNSVSFDRIAKNIPGLSEANQLYHQSNQRILALNGHNVPTNFGLKSHTHHDLDEAGWMTYVQLKGINDAKKWGYSENELAHLVTMASGLSKGVYGGYWSTVMNSHVGFEFVIDTEKSDIEKGIIFYRRMNTMASSSDKGLEKMAPSIDFFVNAEHFEILRNFQALLYSYSPRDLNGKMPKENRWARHEDITGYRTKCEDAMSNGYDNELGRHDQINVFMAATLRDNIVDTAERGGWRDKDYIRNLVYVIDEKGNIKIGKNKRKVVDFELTIKRLRGISESYIKAFIKDIFDPDDSSQSFIENVSDLNIEDLGKDIIKKYEEELKKIDKGWGIDKKLNKLQRDYLLRKFYEKYIYQPIFDRFPTEGIIMEDRRWMPRDEAVKGRNFYDMLTKFTLQHHYLSEMPEGLIGNSYLKLFIAGVQAVEIAKWNEQYEKWEAKIEKGDYSGENHPFDYIFDLTKDDVEKYRDLLRGVYLEYKKGVGIEKRDGKELQIEDDDFLNDLPDFFKEIKKCYKIKRWTLSEEDGHQEGEEETLAQRQARYLQMNMANANTYITWGHMQIQKINTHSSGSRVTERIAGETAVIAESYTKKVSEMIMYKFPELISQKYESDQAFEKAVIDILGPSFKEMSVQLSMVDVDLAYVHLAHLIVQLGVAGGKDRLKRIGVLGNLYDEISKRLGKQSSFMTDNIPDNLREVSTAMTSAQVEIMTVALCKIVGIRRERLYPKGYEPAKFLGKEVHGFWAKFLPRKKIEGKSKISTEALVEVQGVDLKSKMSESALNYPLILMLIVLALAKLAFDKDNKK